VKAWNKFIAAAKLFDKMETIDDATMRAMIPIRKRKRVRNKVKHLVNKKWSLVGGKSWAQGLESATEASLNKIKSMGMDKAKAAMKKNIQESYNTFLSVLGGVGGGGPS